MIYLFTFINLRAARLSEPGAYYTVMGTLESMARYLAANDEDALIHSIQITTEMEEILLGGEYSMLP